MSSDSLSARNCCSVSNTLFGNARNELKLLKARSNSSSRSKPRKQSLSSLLSEFCEDPVALGSCNVGRHEQGKTLYGCGTSPKIRSLWPSHLNKLHKTCSIQ